MYQPVRDDIEIRVKYSNRHLARIYFVRGENWQATKDAIKATGAKFNGSEKFWNVSGTELKALRETFQVKPGDLTISSNQIVLRADQYPALYSFAPTGDGTAPDYDEAYKHLVEIVDRLQSAYSKSDDEFQAALKALPAEKHYRKVEMSD